MNNANTWLNAYRSSCALAALAAAACIGSTANARNDDATAAAPAAAPAPVPAPGQGEIVVTAQRREQKVQDVGIAITAFAGETLRNLGVSSSIDIARITPGVSISGSAGGQDSQFSIRGVTQNDLNDAVEAPVAVYVDDTYIPNLNGQVFGTFDLQRVEVLKGPQGTLFGRNATGGLVHFVPNKPSDTANGFLNVDYGRYNHVRVEGAATVPVSESVSFRFSGLYNRYDPILKNIYPYGVSALVAGTTPPKPNCCQNEWNDDTIALRAQVEIKPAEGLTIRATGSYSRTIYSEDPYNSVATIGVFDAQGRLINTEFASPTETRMNIGPGGINVNSSGVATTATRPTPGGDIFGFRAPSAQSLEVSKDWALDNLNRLKSYDAALHINYDLGGAEIVAISDYRRFHKLNGTDVEAGPENLVDYLDNAHETSFSQEVRVAGTGHTDFRWVAGAYYLHIDAKVQNGFIAPSNSIYAGLFPGFETSGIDLENHTELKTNSASGFGQVEYDFHPKFTFILGGRFIHEHQTYNFVSQAYQSTADYSFSNTPALFPLQDPFNDTRSTNLWAGKAQLEYRPDKGLLFYFGVNRGVKGGAFNAALPGGPSLSPATIPYRPEVLTSYEGGAKTTLLNGLLTLDASGFYYDYHDYQTFAFVNVSGIVSNKNAREYGLEAALTLHPVTGLNIGLGASLLHARVFDVAIATGINKTVHPTFTPSSSFSGQIEYNIPAPIAGGNVSINADGSWRGSMFGNIRNFDSDVIPSYFLANGHIFWTSDNTHYKLGFGVDNMFDRRYRTITYNLTTLCGCDEESYGTPRWWNVTARYRF